MSTRGCVAIKKNDSWEGVYNHFDSYPEGLGIRVYNHLKTIAEDEEALQRFKSELLHAGDWRHYLNGCKCEYCGKQEVGQPHSISGHIVLVGEDVAEKIKKCKKTGNSEIEKNLKQTGYPDPECKYHQHSDLDAVMTPETADAGWIEWIYVIDIKSKKIEIFANHLEKRKKTKERHGWDWAKVAEINLLGEAPDFEMIERAGNELGAEKLEEYEEEECK